MVVDNDAGVLAAIERLLRARAYKPILFSSAEAFRNHTDFGGALCVILDIDLGDGSGIELRPGLNAAGVSVLVIYMIGNDSWADSNATKNRYWMFYYGVTFP